LDLLGLGVSIPAVVVLLGGGGDGVVVAHLQRKQRPKVLGVAHLVQGVVDELLEGRELCHGLVAAAAAASVLAEIERLVVDLLGVGSHGRALAESRLSTSGKHLLRHLIAVLLEVHDRLRNLDVDRLHHHLDVEWTQQTVSDLAECICKSTFISNQHHFTDFIPNWEFSEQELFQISHQKSVFSMIMESNYLLLNFCCNNLYSLT
jgi:hypothetical protein